MVLDLCLEYQRISRLLSPAVKIKIEQQVPGYVAWTRNLVDVRFTAVNLVRSGFPQASTAESEVLIFYLNCCAAIFEIGGLSDMFGLALQTAMDRQSKYIATVSNILKHVSGTSDNLIANLK